MEPRRRQNNEQLLQMSIVQYIDEHYPDTLYTMSPAGIQLSYTVRENLKWLGYRRGTPDLMIFETLPEKYKISRDPSDILGGTLTEITRKQSHGLFIEFKHGNNKQFIEQVQWQKDLEERGYKYLLINDYEQGCKELDNYLSK